MSQSCRIDDMLRIMNQETFDQIFDQLPERQKEVLLKSLKGESDQEIAESLGIATTTVRKHLERVAGALGLQSSERRYRRSQIVAMIAQYKPEVISKPKTKNSSTQRTTVLEENIINIKQWQKPSLEDNLNYESIVIMVESKKGEDVSLLNIIALARKKENKNQVAEKLNQIGYHHYLEGQFKDACLYFQLAIQYEPNFIHAHYNLGATYENLLIIDSAYYHYRIAAKSKTRIAHAAINNISRLEIINRQFDSAIKEITSILEDVEDQQIKASLYKNLAWAYFELGQSNQSKFYLEKSLELDEKYLPSLYLLVLVLLDKGEDNGEQSLSEAIKVWTKCQKQKALDQYPNVTNQLLELSSWESEIHRKIQKCLLTC